VKRRRTSLLLALLAGVTLVAQEPAAPPLAPGGYQVVVLDAAHGGADTGARGAAGLLEKDVTLMLAREVRRALEAQGWRVVETRAGDELVNFDRRAAAANGERGAVFLTLHVGSTGTVGTARAFFLPAIDPQATAAAPPARGDAPPAEGLLRWEAAQEPYLADSRRLAELLQRELAQRLRGSPEEPLPAAIRQLRTIAAPAAAIEVSSVSTRDRRQLDLMGLPLADAVARALGAFRTGGGAAATAAPGMAPGARGKSGVQE
jgi:N-acetylmuramoyl-L-alanine amidase